jgi:regulator of protease activity HflC (stomatin/prohibitin superfamily)
MKKMFRNLLIVTSLVLFLTSCGQHSFVQPGFVGIKVHMYGGSKGVDNELLGVGKYWIGVNERLYLFPTYQINYSYTASKDEGKAVNEEFSFQTKEGMECTMDLGLAMHFEYAKIPKMFQKYHEGLEAIESIVVRNSIRDALNKTAGTMSIESVYGEGKAQLVNTVQTTVKESLDSTGIVIDKLSLIGSVRIPESVKKSLDEKVEMTQKTQQSQFEVQKAEADAKVKIAKAEGEAKSTIIAAEAEAKANKLITSSITDQLIRYKAIDKWDSHLPTVTGGSIPMINIDTKKSDK